MTRSFTLSAAIPLLLVGGAMAGMKPHDQPSHSEWVYCMQELERRFHADTVRVSVPMGVCDSLANLPREVDSSGKPIERSHLGRGFECTRNQLTIHSHSEVTELAFPSGRKAWVTSRSEHDQGEVDMVLGMSDSGKYFMPHQNHVCGRIVLRVMDWKNPHGIDGVEISSEAMRQKIPERVRNRVRKRLPVGGP